MNELHIPVAPVFAPLLVGARYKGAYGGRGSAKSYFFATQVVAYSLSERMDVICIRETQASLAESSKKLIEEVIEMLGLGKRFKVLNTHIESDLGGKIMFQGMQNHTAESIKSLQGYRIAWVEEAQNLSQRSLDLLRPTLRWEDKERGITSEIWFSWNPRFASDPVDSFFRGGSPYPGSVVVRANWSDNPWFPDVLRQEMEYDLARDKDKYAHVWLGEYESHSERRVFKNWAIEDFERPDGTIYRFGADWGFSVDPSVLIRASIEGNRLYVDYESYLVGCEIVNLPDLFDRIPESRKWFITADSARPETIDYMRKNGFPKMNQTIKGPNSIKEGISFLQSFDIVVHPRCVHTIDELSRFSYKTDRLTGEVLPILEDKHNHVIDALRYACEGIRKAKLLKFKKKEREYSGWMAA